jgi:outer membrane lipoprotein-sorting protein
VDTQGNVREVRLIDLRRGVTFAPDFFTFTITEGMEVISK